eukprot:4113461-Amphidinium_carterae.1
MLLRAKLVPPLSLSRVGGPGLVASPIRSKGFLPERRTLHCKLRPRPAGPPGLTRSPAPHAAN